MKAENKKLLSSLTEGDFQDSPCWEVLPDEHEEGPWVSPFSWPKMDRAYYLVAALATLGDGRQCRGFVHVAHHGKLVETGPLTVFSGSGQLRIEASNPGFGYTASPEELPMLPVQWVLSHCLEGESNPRKGSASASRITRFFKQLGYQSRLQSIQRQTYKE